MKTCRICLQTKPETEFSAQASCVGGRKHSCRTCCTAYAKQHYRQNTQNHQRNPAVQFKVCAGCLTEKPASSFYSDPRMTDGMKRKCNDCTCGISRVYARSNVSTKRTQLQARLSNPDARAIHNAKKREYYHRNKAFNKVKRAARSAVYLAVKNGTLIPQPCAVCGSIKSEAHHADYSRKLDVTWLCSTHHGHIHRIHP
jgi:hypothetical protein